MNKKIISTRKIDILIKNYIELRYATGRVSRADEGALRQFNEFLILNYPKLNIPNRFVILHFLNSKINLTNSGRRNYLVYIRQFCIYLKGRGICNYIPDKTLAPKYSYKIRYFPLKTRDIQNILIEAKNIRNSGTISTDTYVTAIGLLWCTGMRRQEIVKLTNADVDLKLNTLMIRLTKFRKNRMLPIDVSVSKVLQKYFLKKKKLGFPVEPENPFFINNNGTNICKSAFGKMFHKIVRRINLCDENGQYPVLHDLRHNFATKTLEMFYSDTEKFPPQSYLATLATYLGHVDMTYSQFYIHPDFDLLKKASEKFQMGSEK
jgi:site-specific recombinase XerD